MKLSKMVLLAAGSLLFAVSGTVDASAAPKLKGYQCDQDNRCVNRNGKTLLVVVRKKRSTPKGGYDYNQPYRFEVGNYGGAPFAYGRNGYYGQTGYFASTGFRSSLGNPSFDKF